MSDIELINTSILVSFFLLGLVIGAALTTVIFHFNRGCNENSRRD
jgi:hypothetical protein